MDKLLAQHIKDLSEELRSTHWAEDRQKLERLIACAGDLLSKVVLEAPQEELFDAIRNFDRMWGHTWLRGTWQEEYPGRYESFKKEAGYISVNDT